jgi:23S rRNA maturation mini-RNase III
VAARLNLAHNGDAKATQQKGDVDIYSVSTALNELLKHARCPVLCLISTALDATIGLFLLFSSYLQPAV